MPRKPNDSDADRDIPTTPDGYIDLSEAYDAQAEAWGYGPKAEETDMSGTDDKDLQRRIAEHPMYSPDDLAYFRAKGYSDQDILAFWDRDHAMGCRPVHHRNAPAAEREDRTRENVEGELASIAGQQLGVETLQPRKSDELDFHTVAVWQVHAALLAAFELGRRTR